VITNDVIANKQGNIRSEIHLND